MLLRCAWRVSNACPNRLAIRTQLYRFAEQHNKDKDKDKLQQNNEKKTEEQFSDFQKNLLKTYKVDPFWNIILDLDKDHNFQKELIVHRKEYEKSTYQLRSAILFEDLLKTQLKIPIYDTKKKPFYWQMLKMVYMVLTIGTSLWGIDLLIQADPRNKILLEKTFYGNIYKAVIYIMCTFLLIVAWGKQMAFRKRYVEKIIYDTMKEEFAFTKRRFWGFKYESVCSRYKLLYTQNPLLNSKGTNYFNIDTKQEFMIIYKDSWIKQDLFSHLISQRIKI